MMENILLFGLFVSGLAIDLPFPSCKRYDPNLNDCLRSAYDASLPFLTKGMSDFGIDSIVPIKLESLTVGEGGGVVHAVQNYKNVECHNLHLTKAKSFDATITDSVFKFTIQIFAKDIHIYAHYQINGYALSLPINGEGECTLSMRNVQGTGNVVGEFFERNGQKFLEIKSFNVSFIPENMEIDFQNLFDGDPQLGTEMNHVLNENWRDLYLDMGPSYEEALGQKFKRILNLICSKIPYDELFPL